MILQIGSRQFVATTVAFLGEDGALYRHGGGWLFCSGEPDEIQGTMRAYPVEQTKRMDQKQAEQWCEQHKIPMAY